ncbi:MAG: ORF6C domain-containing protein [Rhodospirillaceae bacterium]|nr:ORF6C domain-containing protein [Rhodospirillales bacterium]
MDSRKAQIEGKLKEIFSEATAAASKAEAPLRRSVRNKNSVRSVVGDTVAVGDNNVIVINQAPARPRVVAKVEPGAEHISDVQAAKLHELVGQIVDLEAKIKKRPTTFKAVWTSLNSHCKVPSYRLIPSANYSRAEKYLRMWIGRITSAASAPRKTGAEWRKRQYAYIFTNVKQLALSDKLNKLLTAAYGVESVSNLSDDDLRKVYQSVAAWKRAGRG